jgi:IPT/TIG domain-containing protein
VRTDSAYRIVRFVLLICGLGISLLVMPKTAAGQSQGQDITDDECFDLGDGCDVEGVAQILTSTNSGEIDTYVVTIINNLCLLDEGYSAYVEGYLYQNDSQIDYTYAYDDGTGVAESYMSDPVIPTDTYQLEGDHSLSDEFGDIYYLGYTITQVYTGPPVISSFSPLYGFVGTSGTITVQGSYLVDPFTGTINPSFGQGSGVTLQMQSVNTQATQITLAYTASQSASPGTRNVVLSDRFGLSTSTQTFNVGDPPPVISSVSPSAWQAGTSNQNITISGSGFGTSPTVTVSGSGVSLVSVGSTGDTSISATVSIASNAPSETAVVTVQSNGYNGTGFQPAYSGESSTGSYNTMVQAVLAPVPQIQLYGQPIANPQSVVAGQQIALCASVTLPPGMSILSESWSSPQGTAVGGYTNAAGTGPPDATGGQVQLLLSEGTCNSGSSVGSSLIFYWVNSVNSPQITYMYTMSNGEPNSATATFNFSGPPAVTVSAPTGVVSFAAGTPPVMTFGSTTLQNLGLQVTISPATPPSGSYQFVQLISETTYSKRTSTGPLYCHPHNFDIDPNPALDNFYPYPSVTANSTNDNPMLGLYSYNGEEARHFAATMYEMWTPTVSGCPNGWACTIPISLGYVNWYFTEDAINTLKLQPSTQLTYLLSSQSKPPQNPIPFVPSNSFPQWTQTITNTTPTQAGTPQTCQSTP